MRRARAPCLDNSEPKTVAGTLQEKSTDHRRLVALTHCHQLGIPAIDGFALAPVFLLSPESLGVGFVNALRFRSASALRLFPGAHGVSGFSGLVNALGLSIHGAMLMPMMNPLSRQITLSIMIRPPSWRRGVCAPTMPPVASGTTGKAQDSLVSRGR